MIDVLLATIARMTDEKKTTPKNRNEQEIAGYRDVLNTIHENHNMHTKTLCLYPKDPMSLPQRPHAE